MWKKVKVWLGIVGGVVVGVIGFLMGRRYSHGQRVGGAQGTDSGHTDGTAEIGKRVSEYKEQARRDGQVVRDSIGRAEDASGRIGEATGRIEDIIREVEGRRK